MNAKSRKEGILRGEHLINLLEYLNGIRLKWDESRGYSSTFAEKHDEILKNIIENSKKQVEIVTGFDDLCSCGVCPNRKGNCESVELREKDRAVASKHGVIIGRKYKSEDLVELLREAETSEE